MLKSLNKLFTEKLTLAPEMWLYILIAIIAVAFLVTLVAGITAGNFKKIKSLMKRAASDPKAAVVAMKQMPVAIKKQYKRARLSGAEPSMLVTEDMCVDAPYKHSLISKVWLVTLAATVICAAIAYFIVPLASVAAKYEDAETAMFSIPATLLLVGGLLTVIGAIVGAIARSGASKTYAKFVAAIDGAGGADGAAAQAQPQGGQGFAMAEEQPQGVVFEAPADEAAEPVANAYAEPAAEPVYEAAEPMYGEPVVEPVVAVQPEESDEEIRRRAKEEAIARARAEQEARAQAQAQAAAQAAAQAQAAAAQAQAQAQAAAQAQAQAQAQARAAQAQAAQQARAAQAQAAHAKAQAQPQGSSSADDIIARIEQIDRDGAPRETMREVATLLQKERAKPENKTPEQQKRLNEALTKLLKAMSSANRK